MAGGCYCESPTSGLVLLKSGRPCPSFVSSLFGRADGGVISAIFLESGEKGEILKHTTSILMLFEGGTRIEIVRVGVRIPSWVNQKNKSINKREKKKKWAVDDDHFGGWRLSSDK